METKEIRYYYPIGGTKGYSYEVGRELKFKWFVYEIIEVTPKRLKLKFLRKRTVGID